MVLYQFSSPSNDHRGNMLNNMNPGYFPLAATALKPQKYPWFYIFPLGFGDAGDIHKHQNSRILS